MDAVVPVRETHTRAELLPSHRSTLKASIGRFFARAWAAPNIHDTSPNKPDDGHGQVLDFFFALYYQLTYLSAPDSLGLRYSSFSTLLDQIRFALHLF